MVHTDDALVVAQTLIDALNQGDRAKFKSLLTDDAVQTEPSPGLSFTGPEDVARNVWAYRNTFPDLHATILEGFAGGNRVALELGFSGTYEPYTYGARALKITWQGCMIVEVREGKVARFSIYSDRMVILDQLEAIPSGPEHPPHGFVYERLGDVLQRGGSQTP